MDSAGVLMAEDDYIWSGEVFDRIDRYGNVYPLFDLVPLKIDATVKIASPNLNNFICLSA
jgi:hypothetical protein